MADKEDQTTEATSMDCEEEEDQDMEEEEEDYDEDEEYEYEADDDAAGFLVDNPEAAMAAMMEEKATAPSPSSGANKFSEKAVQMSHRVETEKSGGKRRLASDLHKLMSQDTAKSGFTFEPTHEDSMDKWTIHLSQFDKDSELAKDMLVVGVKDIELEMTFPDDYPFEPPFVRVISPRFVRRTGFVVSGALCMELLTKSGWRPTCDIESVIVSIRSLMVEGGGRLEAASTLGSTQYKELLKAAQEGKPAAAKSAGKGQSFHLGSYTEYEAKDGYVRATAQHKDGYSDDLTRRG